MKHATPTINAVRRDRTGTRYSRRLRQQGQLPAVIYGHRIDPLAVSVSEKEILGHLHHGAHVINLEIEGVGAETCLVKDLQYGYLGDNVVHIDFTRVNLDEQVTVQVHLVFIGQPAEARRAGAILQHDQTELTVSCRVLDIPEEIRVDLDSMVGTLLPAGSVPLPPGVVLAEDPARSVASVSFVREEAEAPAGEAAEVGAQPAEPEVIGAKPAEAEGEE